MAAWRLRRLSQASGAGSTEEEVPQLLPTQGTCGSFDIGGTRGGFDGVRVRLALGEGEEEVRQLLPMQEGAYVEALTTSWRWSWERSHAGFDVVHTHVHTLREWQWRKLAAGSTTCRHPWRLRRFSQASGAGSTEEEVPQLLPTQGTCGSFDIGGTRGGFDGVRVRLALGEGEEEVRQLLPMQYVEALTTSWRWSWERSHAGFDVVHTHVHTLREWQWRKLAAGSTTCRHPWRLRRFSQASGAGSS